MGIEVVNIQRWKGCAWWMSRGKSKPMDPKGYIVEEDKMWSLTKDVRAEPSMYIEKMKSWLHLGSFNKCGGGPKS